MLESRFEKVNEYDLEVGLMRTLKKISDRININAELLSITESPEVAERLLEEIKNDEAEMKFIASSLLFEKDMLMMIQTSSIYRRMEG